MNKQLHILVLLIVLGLFVVPSYAQEEEVEESTIRTLLGDGTEHGGYGSFSVGYSKIGNHDALTVGGRGAWLMNHNLALGVAATGFATGRFSSAFIPENEVFMSGGYIGLLIEPIFYADKPIHFSTPLFFAGGGIDYVRETYINDPADPHVPNIYSGFILFEPGIEVEMNVVKFLRIALGISYRITSDINLTADVNGDNVELLGKDDLNKFVVKLIFKFGKF